MSWAAAALLLFLPAGKAEALTIFGVTLWGEKPDTVDVIDPVSYSISIDSGAADADLARTLADSSLLKRDEGKPASGDLGLLIRAQDDRDRLVAALYENARYGGVVTVTVAGRPIDAIEPNPTFSHQRPVPVAIRIDPGPRFTLGRVALKGDAARLDPASYDLVTGADAGSLVILKAADRIAADLKAEGRPLARVVGREVVADHKTRTVDVIITAEAGPVAPIGTVAVKGDKSVDGDFVQHYSRLEPGRTYSPAEIEKAAERLRKLGVFASVTIREAKQLAPDGSLPLTIEVAEGKHRYIGVGATVSSLDGLGLQGYWGHRNLFGAAEGLRIEGAIGRLGDTSQLRDFDYSTGISFSKPGAFLPAMTLNASIKAATRSTTAYDADSITGRLGLSYELSERNTISAAAALEWSDIEDAFGTNRYLTFGLPVEFARDARDNELDPKSGYRLTFNVTPGYEFHNETFFAALEASASAYHSIGEDDRVTLAGRASAGTLFDTGGLRDIPATRRFYLGGGGSVRGYAYEEISPYTSEGKATGGRSYAAFSAEARVKITETIGLVPFFDAGTVSSQHYPDFSDIRMGAGLGLRYATPFGPIRLDVAFPLDRYPGGASYGIYAGIGQSF